MHAWLLAVAVLGSNAVPHDTIDRNAIRKVVKQHTKDIHACWETELQNDRAFNFTVVIGFVIAKNGKPVGVKADRDGTLATCLVGVFKRMRFPAPKTGEITVSYPVKPGRIVGA